MCDEFYRAYLINLVEDVLQARDSDQGEVVSVDPLFSLVAARPVPQAELVLNLQRGLNSQAGHLLSHTVTRLSLTLY